MAPPARQLTANQVAHEALAAGFQGEDAVTAVAVALAESGGNANAFNDNPITRDLSYGLWQINMYGPLGPERRKQFGLSKNEDLYGSAINARAAKKLRDTPIGWGHWSVYKSGTYRAFIVPATIAVRTPQNPGVIVADPPWPQIPDPSQGQGTTTEIDLLKPFKDLLSWLIDQLRPFGVRVAGFVGGGLLILVGIVLYVRGQVNT